MKLNETEFRALLSEHTPSKVGGDIYCYGPIDGLNRCVRGDDVRKGAKRTGDVVVGEGDTCDRAKHDLEAHIRANKTGP